MLDVSDSKPDIRDKKLRVRIDGKRIVPYYTRAQIDQGVLAVERVIVWVDDLAALYSMQVQGSGKVRLPDGQLLRLAYAEQNGHPFLPPVQVAGRKERIGAGDGADEGHRDPGIRCRQRRECDCASRPIRRTLRPFAACNLMDGAEQRAGPPPAPKPPMRT